MTVWETHLVLCQGNVIVLRQAPEDVCVYLQDLDIVTLAFVWFIVGLVTSLNLLVSCSVKAMKSCHCLLRGRIPYQCGVCYFFCENTYYW